MDFKSLINKLDSMEAPIKTPSAPILEKAVQLNEDAELRVLAGTSSYVTEAKKKADEDVKEEMKVGDKKASSTGGTIEKTATGVKHTAGKNYGGDKAPKDEDDDAPKSKKKKNEDIEPVFKSKFMKMVEAKKEEADKKKADKKKKMEEGAKPDFLDMDKDGNKKEPMKKAVADKKKGAVAKDVKEAEEKRAPAKKTEREVTLPSGAKTKATKVQGWQSQKADKEADKEKNESFVNELSPNTLKSYKAKADKEVTDHLTGEKDSKNVLKRWKGADKAGDKLAKESKMMPKGKKRPVKESVESKLTFKEMMALVVESGGQQQIDPVDQQLFVWAQRVAKSKFNEGMKAEVYAGMVYERMGGRFEMYDVLSEDQK